MYVPFSVSVSVLRRSARVAGVSSQDHHMVNLREQAWKRAREAKAGVLNDHGFAARFLVEQGEEEGLPLGEKQRCIKRERDQRREL